MERLKKFHTLNLFNPAQHEISNRSNRLKNLALKRLFVVLILLISAKMPTIVGILTLMSRITPMLSFVEYEKVYNYKAWADVKEAL